MADNRKKIIKRRNRDWWRRVSFQAWIQHFLEMRSVLTISILSFLLKSTVGQKTFDNFDIDVDSAVIWCSSYKIHFLCLRLSERISYTVCCYARNLFLTTLGLRARLQPTQLEQGPGAILTTLYFLRNLRMDQDAKIFLPGKPS